MKKPIALLLLLGLSISTLYAQTATQVAVSGTSSTNTIPNNSATAVDPALVITSNGNISGFSAIITDSYTTGDILSYTGALPSGVTATAFNTTTRSLVFSGSTSAANWQTLLRTVTLATTSATCFPEKRAVAFVAGNKNYNPLTGHFYEYNSTLLNWVNAKNYAATQSYFGREGYLATITSAAENNFIWKIMPADAWVGGTYDNAQLTAAGITAYANQTAANGNVYWSTGPEKGTFISAGLGSPVAQNGSYMNWTSGEPNNYNSSGEYYVQLYSSTQGLWNDLPISSTLTSIIEYGGMPNDLTTSTVVFTRNIYVNGAPSGTISGGGTSVCSGANSATLSLSGYTGSVVRWESSLDNFLTAGTTISNTSSSLTVNNLTQTTYYRAVVNTTSPATCSNLTTSSVPVYVTATIAGNIFSNNTTICPGSQANLTLYGNSGAILKWQVSTSSTFASAVTDISSTVNNISYTLSSTGTYYFRAQVQNNGCGSPVYTPGYTITVTSGTAPVGGAVNSAEFCNSTNSGTLTLTGNTGTVQKWQYSVDNGIIWTDIVNTTSSQAYSNVATTSLYRAVVTNSGCGTANSSNGSVVIYGNTQYQWLGTTSTTSSITSNWKCGVAPPSGADVVISNTATNDIVLDQSLTLGSIDFSNSGRKIYLGNYNLTVNSLTGANSTNYIVTDGTGKLKISIGNNSSTTLPVGRSAYNPVTITNKSGSVDDFSVIVLDEVYANGSNGTAVSSPRVKRTWDISKTNANGGSGINFVFNWNSGETSGVLNAAMYHYQSGAWVKQTGTTSSTSVSLTYTGYTGTFSPFAVGDNAMILPLTWISFSAQKNGNTALLNWTTANEQNTNSFIIQHSTDGINWTQVGSEKAAVNNSGESNYSFVHTSPENGYNFYRILQIDRDGRSSYSKTASVYFGDNAARLNIFPNPVVTGQLNVVMPKAAQIRIFNGEGKLVLKKQLTKGVQTIDVSKLAKGTYSIQAEEESKTFIVL
jgi:hypothetical protein